MPSHIHIPLTQLSPVATPGLVASMMMQCCNGIAFLHSKNIVHRDIKLGNFLVDNHYNCFVIDFGVSRVTAVNPSSKMTVIGTHTVSYITSSSLFVCTVFLIQSYATLGTPSYMAPEVLDAQPYGVKADTYSFALVLWSIVRAFIADHLHRLLQQNYHPQCSSPPSLLLPLFLLFTHTSARWRNPLF